MFDPLMLVTNGVGGAPRFNRIQMLSYGVCECTDGYWRACQSILGQLSFTCQIYSFVIDKPATAFGVVFDPFNGATQRVLSSQFSITRELNYALPTVVREVEDGQKAIFI